MLIDGLMQPVFPTVSTPCHTCQSLAGHPWCVSVGNDYGKTRLYSPIRLKTTALLRCACHHSVQRGCPSPPRRGDESAGKRSHWNCSSSPDWVRLLQPLLPRPQKRRRPATYSRSQTPELCPDEKVIQDDHFETDPLENMPRGLLALASVKRVGDLQALSANPACLEFGPNDSKVVLKPRLCYVPKVLSTPFRAQVIALSVLFPPTGSQESLLCPVRALKVYIEHSASYIKSELGQSLA